MIAALGYGQALFRPFRADGVPCNRYAGIGSAQGGACGFAAALCPWLSCLGPFGARRVWSTKEVRRL